MHILIYIYIYPAVGYRPFGPQTNVPVSTVTGAGWSQCLGGSKGNEDITKNDWYNLRDGACNAAFVMVACREVGSSTLKVAAWASHDDVFNPTMTSNKCVVSVRFAP